MILWELPTHCPLCNKKVNSTFSSPVVERLSCEDHFHIVFKPSLESKKHIGFVSIFAIQKNSFNLTYSNDKLGYFYNCETYDLIKEIVVTSSSIEMISFSTFVQTYQEILCFQ